MSISLKQVEFGYVRDRPLFEALDLVVPDGASVALMGPSGTGKSTVLALLGLLLTPTRGEVLLDDLPVPRAGPHHRRIVAESISWVFQTVSLLPGRTVLDNVALGLLARGARRAAIEQQCRAALDGVGLADLADRKINTLSGGEIQRACVARCLVTAPRVVLADEPTGQLDAANSMLVMDAMLGLRNGSTSVVIATHDPAVAARCDQQVKLTPMTYGRR